MDIRPRRPVQRPPVAPPAIPIVPLAPVGPPLEEPVKKPRFSKKKIILIAIPVILAILIIAAVSWYYWALQAKTSSDKAVEVRILVNKGDGANVIAQKLESSGLIHSATAMVLYTELTHTKSALQAGGYLLSSAQSVSSIVSHLTSGKTDEFTVTILPGASISDITRLLVKDGYSQDEVNAALTAHYSNPLLVGKPASASLEGYLYPDSYRVNAYDNLETFFGHVFDHFYTVLQTNGLTDAFKAHGLNLYQGLTLASIVQKETGVTTDQAQVAQVFYRRLDQGVPLGSDVTFIYAAKQLGVTPSPSLDSPYNTRLYAGLPPGPISNMGLTALQAVANPAAGDYNYFVADENGKTYFAHTLDEHNANIAAHCKTCSQ